MNKQDYFVIKLLSKIMLTSDVMELRFSKPEGFEFLAGQFVQFFVPDSDKIVTRSYSISSAPDEDFLEYLVKVLPGGKASQFFANLKVGDGAKIGSPRGFFTIKPEHTSKKIFIATGVGLAPIVSMIEDELARPHPALPLKGEGIASPSFQGGGRRRSISSIQLVFGVRSEQDLFWQERLNKIGEQVNRDVKISLSQPSESWDGLKGRVTEHLMIDENAEYYICGSLEMVKDVKKILVDNKIAPGRIHFEIF